MADGNDASAQVGDHYGGALNNLRSTVKWLVASAGAVAAAIITGAQLVDYSGRNRWGVALAALAVVVALSLTMVLLLRAARILTVPRPSLVDLANAETRAGVNKPGALEKGQLNDPKVVWVLARRSYVLGTHHTVEDLLSAHTAAVETVEKDPKDAEAQKSLSYVQRQIGTVEEAAHYRDMTAAYNKLLDGFGKGAVLFIFAVVAFSISGLLRDEAPDKPKNPVTTPIPVRVVTTDNSQSAPPECRDRLGVAIDGTLTAPTVVMLPSDQCAAETLAPRAGSIVIPQVARPDP